MLFVFTCIDKPNSAELRLRLRVPHIEYMIRTLDRTAFGGPIKDEDGVSSLGSVFAIDFPDRAAAEAFLADEPYTKGGLFQSTEIRRWKQMVPEPEPGFLQKELERERAKQQASGGEALTGE